MEKFLERHKLEIDSRKDNLNRPISSEEIEAVINKLIKSMPR